MKSIVILPSILFLLVACSPTEVGVSGAEYFTLQFEIDGDVVSPYETPYRVWLDVTEKVVGNERELNSPNLYRDAEGHYWAPLGEAFDQMQLANGETLGQDAFHLNSGFCDDRVCDEIRFAPESTIEMWDDAPDLWRSITLDRPESGKRFELEVRDGLERSHLAILITAIVMRGDSIHVEAVWREGTTPWREPANRDRQ